MSRIYTDETAFNLDIRTHHEAGHAVIYRALGGRVLYVQMHPDGQHGGVTRVDRNDTDDDAARVLPTLMAGCEAQARFMATYGDGYSLGSARRESHSDSKSDLDRLRALCRGARVSQRSIRRETATLVRRHWRWIHDVATELSATGYLPGTAL